MPDYSKILKVILDSYGAASYRLPAGYALPPLHYYLLITQNCNLRCTMCHFLEHFGRAGERSELTTEEFISVIRQLPSFSLVSFSGGEPLLRKDAMVLLGAASEKNRCHLITNGTLLDEEKAEALRLMGSKSLFGKGLVMVGFSLEGSEKTHDRITNRPGSFARTVRGIQTMIAARNAGGRKYPLTHLTVVIGEDNADELFEMYRLASGLGIDVCNYVIKNMSEFVHYLHEGEGETGLMTPPPPPDAVDKDRLVQQIARITAERGKSRTQVRFSPLPVEEVFRYYSGELDLGDYSCRYPWRKMGVLSNGDVFGCHYLKMGNVKSASLSDIWNGRLYREFRKRIKKQRVFPGCMGCCYMEHMG